MRGPVTSTNENADRMECELTWRVHPAGERLSSAVFGTLAILIIVGLVYISSESLPWSLMAMLVLVLSLNRFYFPSRFTIDHEGISARYPLRRQRYSWRDVRRFLHDERGGYLSSHGRASRLDAYRGMHILFGRHREDVLREIRNHLGSGQG